MEYRSGPVGYLTWPDHRLDLVEENELVMGSRRRACSGLLTEAHRDDLADFLQTLMQVRDVWSRTQTVTAPNLRVDFY